MFAKHGRSSASFCVGFLFVMKMYLDRMVSLLPAVFLSFDSVVSDDDSSKHWPGFRGGGNSIASVQTLPERWSDGSVAWRAALPRSGQSSPVIWDDRLFTTSAEGANKETLHILCHDLETGLELWRRELRNSVPEKVTDYISRAAPTPAVDEKRVYALFESGDLASLTHEGKTVWKRNLSRDYGPFEGNHGQGSSPVLSSRGLVVVMDHKGDSFIASFAKNTGKTLWKTPRPTSSAWASPVIRRRADGIEEIVCSASNTVAGYDPARGTLLWNFNDIAGNNVPTATAFGKWIFVGSSSKNNSLLLRLENGQPEIVWKAAEASSSFGSPLVHNDRVYLVNKAGVLFCYALESGRLLFDRRLPSSTWASPLGAGDQIWFFCKEGSTVVMESADTPKVLSTASLKVDEKDRVYGYAVASGKFVFRLGAELICISQ